MVKPKETDNKEKNKTWGLQPTIYTIPLDTRKNQQTTSYGKIKKTWTSYPPNVVTMNIITNLNTIRKTNKPHPDQNTAEKQARKMDMIRHINHKCNTISHLKPRDLLT